MTLSMESLTQIVKEAVSAALAEALPTLLAHSKPVESKIPTTSTSSSSQVLPPKPPPGPSESHTLPLIPNALVYVESDVPEPPAGVGLDVDRLSTIWDDSWTSWKNTSPLIINNRPVPLRHFRSVYIHTPHWKQLKQQWSKWKVRAAL
jgi:hypothetical protein